MDKVDILKFATLIRDPLTMEINVSFETRPSKSDDMRNLSWQKVHQDAIKHLDENNLKNQYINQNSIMEDGTVALITDKSY